VSHVGVNLGFGNLHENLTDEPMYLGELALAVLTDRLGFDSLWAVEHHFDDYAMCPDNVVLLANVAARTERVKLGTGAVILPWNDPLRVAEKMIMLDIVSGGRALFGMGRGLSRMEYAPFGIEMSESRERFDEAAAMIAEALESGWIGGDGPYYPRPRTQLRPSPPRSFRDRLYCVAGSPDSVASCVSLGASLLTIVTQPVPNLMPVFTSYREQYRAARGTEAPPIALNVNMYCHEDADVARERSLRYIHAFFASNVRHYEFMGHHFSQTKGYERYDEVARMFRQAGLEAAADAYAACALARGGVPGAGGAQGPDPGRDPGGLSLGGGLPAGRVPARPAAGLAHAQGRAGRGLPCRRGTGRFRGNARAADGPGLPGQSVRAPAAAGDAGRQQPPPELAEVAGSRGARQLLDRAELPRRPRPGGRPGAARRRLVRPVPRRDAGQLHDVVRARGDRACAPRPAADRRRVDAHRPDRDRG